VPNLLCWNSIVKKGVPDSKQMVRFKRIHDTGTETLILQDSDGWRVQINLREANRNPGTIAGYLTTNVESAKEVADREILKYGHVCSGSCKDWVAS
jgi:hypothetical protein